MDTLAAFAMERAHQDQPSKVFDWNKAAQIIKKRKPEEARAGLSGDMEWTGGTIFEDGKPDKDSYTYLASVWATPILVIEDEEIPCWIYESETEFESKTKWPQSALDILNG